MSFGFYRQPRLTIRGDGDGNVVFEEFVDDDCLIMTSKMVISWERFELLQQFWDELRDEAFYKTGDDHEL